MKLIFGFAFAFLAALVSGCGRSADDAKVQQLEARLTALEATQAKSQTVVTDLDRLRLDVWLLKSASSNTAWFDPQDQQSYSAIDGPIGRVLFVLEKVEPYLDGFKVTFRVGNPTSADFNGFEAKIEWGPKPPEDTTASVPTKKTVNVKFSETMRAGSWSFVTANLAPAKAEEIRQIGITPKFSNIGLAVRRQ